MKLESTFVSISSKRGDDYQIRINFINNNKMKKGTYIQQSAVKIDKSKALFNLLLVIVLLGLTLSLSVNTNYLFFKELSVSAIIILSVSIMQFFKTDM